MTYCFWSIYIKGQPMQTSYGEIYIYDTWKDARDTAWMCYGSIGKRYGVEIYAA